MIKKLGYSIIIPNYNGSHFLKDCLESLFISLKKIPDSKFEIILVDNGSHDDSVEVFKNFFTKNKTSELQSNIYHLKSNYGFAKAVNQGILKASYEWVILLNNDITINKQWFQIISREINNIKDQKIVTVFGTVLDKTGQRIESQGLKFYYRGKAQNINNNKLYRQSIIKDQKPKFVWGASAALVVYNKEVIKKVGLFDKDFFAYEEDVDLALRLHNLGYKTLYVPQAISYHLGGGTSNKMGNFRNIMDSKNWFYIIIKNFSKKELLNNFFPIIEERFRNLSGLTKLTIRTYGLKSFYLLPLSLIKAYGEVLVKIPAMINKRNQIKKLIRNNSI